MFAHREQSTRTDETEPTDSGLRCTDWWIAVLPEISTTVPRQLCSSEEIVSPDGAVPSYGAEYRTPYV